MPAPAPAPRAPRRAAYVVAVALLLLAALALRLGYVEATPDYGLRHDAYDYDVHARSIAQGEGYSARLAYERSTAFRPPGYPFFLAGVYELAGVDRAPVRERIEPARLAQALVGTVIVALIGLLAAQLWGRRVALVALALGALYLPLILVGGALMSEPLFVAFMLGGLCAALAYRRSPHRHRFVVLAGLLTGLAILTRANAAVLILPLIAAVWVGRPRFALRSLAAPALLVAMTVLAVMPWTVRNLIVFDRFVPVSTQLGSALAGTYNDDARRDERNPASWRSLKHVRSYADLWAQRRTTPEPVLEQRLRSRALDYARAHPGYVLEVGWWNTRRMLELAGRARSRATAATISVDHGWADAGILCFWVFGALAVAGALTGRARGTPALVWAFPALTFVGLIFLVVETPRYRAGIDPFIVLLAALALVSVASRVRGGRTERAGTAGRLARHQGAPGSHEAGGETIPPR